MFVLQVLVVLWNSYIVKEVQKKSWKWRSRGLQYVINSLLDKFVQMSQKHLGWVGMSAEARWNCVFSLQLSVSDNLQDQRPASDFKRYDAGLIMCEVGLIMCDFSFNWCDFDLNKNDISPKIYEKSNLQKKKYSWEIAKKYKLQSREIYNIVKTNAVVHFLAACGTCCFALPYWPAATLLANLSWTPTTTRRSPHPSPWGWTRPSSRPPSTWGTSWRCQRAYRGSAWRWDESLYSPFFQWFVHQKIFPEGVSHSFLVRHKDRCEQDPVARRGWEGQVRFSGRMSALANETHPQVPHSDHGGRRQILDARPLCWQSSPNQRSQQGCHLWVFLVSYEFWAKNCFLSGLLFHSAGHTPTVRR